MPGKAWQQKQEAERSNFIPAPEAEIKRENRKWGEAINPHSPPPVMNFLLQDSTP